MRKTRFFMINNHDYGSIFTKIIIVVVTLLVLAAGVYVGAFNFFSYDDFSRLEGDLSFFERIFTWYLHHNGRYTNALLVNFKIVYFLPFYRILHIINIALWLSAIFCFYYGYINYFFESFKGSNVVYLSFLTFLTIISGAPNLGEWWFWYASSSVYMTGSAFLFLAVGLFLLSLQDNRRHYIFLSCLFYFLACGSHELLAMVCVVVSFVSWLAIRDIRSFYPLIFCILGMLLMVLSPGSSQRLEIVSGLSILEQFKQQLPIIIEGTYSTLKSGLKYWINNKIWIFLVLLTLLVGLHKTTDVKKTSSLRYYVVLIISLGVLICIGLLPVLLNWKVNINGPNRLANLGYLLFLVILVLSFLNLSTFIKKYSFFDVYSKNSLLRNSISTVFVILFTYNVFISKNIQILSDDIANNRPARQAETLRIWDQVVESEKKSNNPKIILPGLIPSHTLTVARYGPTHDENYHFNKMWAKYYDLGKNKSLVVKHFDYWLLEHIKEFGFPLNQAYSLSHFKDDYRNYLLVRIANPIVSDSSFCVDLERSYKVNENTRDESIKSLNFQWKDNTHCTQFGKRRLFCQKELNTWICRIPLPLEFQGLIKTNWNDNYQEIIAS